MDQSQESFETLIDQHRKILYKVSSLYCRNPHDREDLAQQIVVQLWQAFPSFDGRRAFSTWMYRVALNVAISWYRREKTRARYVLTGGEHILNIAADADTPSDDVRLLYQFIESLDELNKALILLYLDGYSNREIGEVLGISETNVTTKISRLKKTCSWSLPECERAEHGTRRIESKVAGTRPQARIVDTVEPAAAAR